MSERSAIILGAILGAIGLCIGGHLDLQACIALGDCK